MKPAISRLLRLVLDMVVLLLLVLLVSLADYAIAATPLPQAPHSVLETVGPQAGHILDLWRIFVVICTLVFAVVLAALLYVIWRRPRSDQHTAPDLSMLNQREPRPRR